MSTPDRPSIILDCDPGHDDAAAIVVAAHFTDLRALTTVGGNAPLERTTHNALVLRDLLELDVPVHSGAANPLVRKARTAPQVHGESGLDGADLPAPTTPLDGDSAAEVIVEMVRAEEGLWLVPTGPLTNIALAIQIDATIIDRIAGISLMGGGRFGNMTAMAEFNIGVDPEAAAIVFEAFEGRTGESAPRLIMAGLHLTHQFQMSPDRIDKVRSVGGVLAETLADLLTFFSAMYLNNHDAGTMEGAALHDPLAVLALTHPELFDRSRRHVGIETEGARTAGMTVIDERHITSRQRPNCDVLETVDAGRAFDLLVTAIAAFSTTATR